MAEKPHLWDSLAALGHPGMSLTYVRSTYNLGGATVDMETAFKTSHQMFTLGEIRGPWSFLYINVSKFPGSPFNGEPFLKRHPQTANELIAWVLMMYPE